MRSALRLLVMTCLIWCALGVAEPAQAHVDLRGQPVSLAIGHADALPDDDGTTAPVQGDHHHCPVAPDLPPVRTAAPKIAHSDLVFAPRIAALASLTRAPPLQPPATA